MGTVVSAPANQRLILDEVHCPVQGDFRPAYRRLGAVRPALLKSARDTNSDRSLYCHEDPAQAQIIQQVLQLKQPVVFGLIPTGKICTSSFK